MDEEDGNGIPRVTMSSVGGAVKELDHIQI